MTKTTGTTAADKAAQDAEAKAAAADTAAVDAESAAAASDAVPSAVPPSTLDLANKDLAARNRATGNAPLTPGQTSTTVGPVPGTPAHTAAGGTYPSVDQRLMPQPLDKATQAAQRLAMDSPEPFREQKVDESDAQYTIAKDEYLKQMRDEHIANAQKAAAEVPSVHPYSSAAAYFTSPENLLDELAEYIRTTHGLAGDKQMMQKVHDYLALHILPAPTPDESVPA